MDARVHIIVHGLVQGVGFRWFVAREAGALGLHGFVKNRPEGTVELEAEGDRSLVESLIAHVKVGPRSAQVRDLTIEWQQPQNDMKPFEIR
jgi:acylphosphatase